MPSSLTTRRQFLAGSASSLFAAPFVTSGLRAASPNGKLQHASFGAAGMAGSDWNSMSRHEMFQLVAVCDVDTRKFEGAKKRWPEVRCYQDWRELLEKEGDKIDSVNVGTPDHMHGPIGIAAMQRGKHLYGQKPLTQNLWECRQMMLAAREKNVMTLLGIQVSSDFTERLAVELIHLGAIGKVKEAHTYSNKKWGDMEPRPAKSDPIPPELDWDLWLGVAKERSYIAGYDHPSNWRKRRDFGTGTLGDMGCHMFSGWFRSLALAAPISVKSTGSVPNADNWAINGKVEYKFKGTQYTEGSEVTVTWYDGDHQPPPEIIAASGGKFTGQGTIYLGTDGVLLHAHGQTPRLYPQEKFTGYKYPKLEPRDHWMEFLNACMKGGAKPSANFDYAGPLTEAVLLGCLASAFPGETLQWDSPGLKIPNSEAADKLVRREYRQGWEIAA